MKKTTRAAAAEMLAMNTHLCARNFRLSCNQLFFTLGATFRSSRTFGLDDLGCSLELQKVTTHFLRLRFVHELLLLQLALGLFLRPERLVLGPRFL